MPLKKGEGGGQASICAQPRKKGENQLDLAYKYAGYHVKETGRQTQQN